MGKKKIKIFSSGKWSQNADIWIQYVGLVLSMKYGLRTQRDMLKGSFVRLKTKRNKKERGLRII